jgi:hypothetical protein
VQFSQEQIVDDEQVGGLDLDAKLPEGSQFARSTMSSTSWWASP